MQRTLTADKDRTTIQPIDVVLNQPVTDTSHPMVIRLTSVKKPQIRSSVTLKNNRIDTSSTIAKVDGNNEQKDRMKKSKWISVVKLPRIETSMTPKTSTQ